MNSTYINSTIVINRVVYQRFELNKPKISLNADTSNLLILCNFVSFNEKLLNNKEFKSILFGGVLN